MAKVTVYLPKHAHLTVKLTDSVVFGQPLTDSQNPETVSYDLLHLLSIKPRDLSKVLSVKQGDIVEKGTVLAKNKTVGGLVSKWVKATFQGTVSTIDRENGIITVSPEFVAPEPIVSPVFGKISKVSEGELEITFKGGVLYAKQGIGTIKKGQLVALTKEDENVILSQISGDHAQKVIMGGSFTKQVLEKAFGIGVVSVIATSLEPHVFSHFEENPYFPVSLALVAKTDYQELTKLGGKEAIVDGKQKRIIVDTYAGET